MQSSAGVDLLRLGPVSTYDVFSSSTEPWSLFCICLEPQGRERQDAIASSRNPPHVLDSSAILLQNQLGSWLRCFIRAMVGCFIKGKVGGPSYAGQTQGTWAVALDTGLSK